MLRTLWALQKEDHRLHELEAELDRIPAQLRALEERVVSARHAVEGHLEDSKKLQLERRTREKDVDSLTEQERKFQSQLFQVKTNQEYQALLREIEAVRGKRSEVETLILEGMESEQQMATARTEHERTLREVERVGAVRRDELEAERAELSERVSRQRAAREALTARLSPGLRVRYQRIHDAREGVAVVPVVRNACGGCMRQLPPQRVQEARRQDVVVTCDGCGRMVLWPPDEA